MSVARTLTAVDQRLETYVEQLAAFVRIPSISTEPDERARAALGEAAGFLVSDLRRLGMQADAVQVAGVGNPLVVARPAALSPDRPTVVVYGHYDVQGVDNPRSAWSREPFAAERDGEYLLGRGASDNKGQLLAHVKAVDAMRAGGDQPPVNLVFLIEGEEECGSGSLRRFIDAGGLDEFLPVACVVVSDGSMFGPDRPSLTVGLRGIVYVEATVQVADADLHSGLFGGVVRNPNMLLADALAGLVDDEGRVSVAGFYDGVREVPPAERALYASLPVDEAALCRTLGVSRLVGEPGYSVLERRWTRPTADANYLAGGSRRTVIPARATAGISCRLVPDQDPQRILDALQRHLRSRLPEDCRLGFAQAHASPPYELPLDDPLVAPTLSAIRAGFGIEPVLTREGGSIPIVTGLAAATAAPVLLVGLGQITDNWHGPNERFSLRDYHRGIRTAAALLYELGGAASRR